MCVACALGQSGAALKNEPCPVHHQVFATEEVTLMRLAIVSDIHGNLHWIRNGAADWAEWLAIGWAAAA